MKTQLTFALCMLSAAACSHRTQQPESASADRTVITRTDAEEERAAIPSAPRRASTDFASSDTPAKRSQLSPNAESRAKTEQPGTRLTDSGNTESPRVAPDNTAVNERDRSDAAMTPLDQGDSERDRTLTQQIRRAVMGDDSLSFTAKNVKIITNEGKVTLRGPVNSQSERSTIDNFARRIAGQNAVDNQLEVKP